MGGGAIRAAAKVAAFRSPAIFAGRRRTSVPTASAAAHAAASEAALSAQTSDKARPEASVNRPALDLDDWEFAGWAAEDEAVAVMAAPRVVFGPVPSFEEAKAATDELREAIHRTNISQAATADSTIIPQMPRHVVQAFSFLQGSPEAQDVVASLACDRNVWNAVLSNEKVMEFYNNHQAVITQVDTEDYPENVNGNEYKESSADSNPRSGFKNLIENFKIKVEAVVKSISNFFQDYLGSSPVSSDAKTAQNNAGSFKETSMGVGAAFFALAIATILVVMFKRA